MFGIKKSTSKIINWTILVYILMSFAFVSINPASWPLAARVIAGIVLFVIALVLKINEWDSKNGEIKVSQTNTYGVHTHE